MNAILGVIFHFLGGFASGSFYMAFKNVRKWAWESYWLIGGLFSWLIIPPLAAFLTIPGFGDIIQQSESTVFTWTYIMGVMWGIGGLTYGLGIRFLGMSLGNSVILGYCAAFGSLTVGTPGAASPRRTMTIGIPRSAATCILAHV